MNPFHPDRAYSRSKVLGYDPQNPPDEPPDEGVCAPLEDPPADVIACGARPYVKLCPDCIDAYRNGIEPGESACDERHNGTRQHP